MKIINLRFLFGILCIFTLSIEAANSVSFKNISELESGNLKIVFKLDKVALINSYALDDPSRIVIDLKDVALEEQIKSGSFSPIKLIRASEVGNMTRIVVDLKGSVYWKKPWQVKHKDRIDLVLEIKRDRKISQNLRDIIVAIDAGHGGRDPGSVGKNILEKDVTLLIARELERTLKNTYGYKPVMIRSDDRYVGIG
jgi:N-acetylmuramoyl-L-alanine amidase